jgi:glutamine synthetase
MTAGTDPSDAGAAFARLSTGSVDFVDEHDLWDDRRRAAAAELAETLDDLDFVRVVFGDPHGLVRGKTLPARAFRGVLANGIDMSPGPYVFDTGHAVAVDFFAPGGGIGVDELTGAGDFILVPDPLTFRMLPHTTSRCGWVVADEYLRSGEPHPLSSRWVLRRLVDELAAADRAYVTGLEVEWYLTRYVDGGRPRAVGGFGVQGEPPLVEPVDGGYQFNFDGLVDALMPVLEPLADALQRTGLPLRTMEHESGPGQLEFTFDPMTALEAADAMLLFRSLAKQICGRLGYHASFMALPGLANFDPSGWHLHQSLFEPSSGRYLFASSGGVALLSDAGRQFVGGLLAHAAEAAVLCVPTLNGYRRMSEAFSLSPDRVVWSPENRGAFVRVLGRPGAPSTHVENRIGEPCANPYLYLASQLAAGLDGIARGLDPGDPAADPHAASAPPLPADLREAVAALDGSALYRRTLGDPLVDCLCLLKRSEIGRFDEWLAKAGPIEGDGASEWEHREYFATY